MLNVLDRVLQHPDLLSGQGAAGDDRPADAGQPALDCTTEDLIRLRAALQAIT
jgi:hypothetical protein